MKPGIQKIDAEAYHAFDAACNSRLGWIRDRSPAHCRWKIDHQEPSKPGGAMWMGSAMHCAVLEPYRFAVAYRQGPDCNRGTKEWKAAEADAGAGVELMKPDEWAKVQGMREAVMAHPKARVLIERAADIEVSALWTDDGTGQPCKLRADLLANVADGLALGDLKKTQNASRAEFERTIYTFGYHRQMAFYRAGLEACGVETAGAAIVAVEEEPPHGVAVYQINEQALYVGAEEWRRLLDKYAECVRTNHWPGYADKIELIGIPNWAMRKEEVAA